MSTFFTADTHFGHHNIIDFCNRPWPTRDEHDEGLVSNWNSVVKPKDTVYHLGDFALSTNGHAQRVLDRLNGQIHIITGNHDKMIKGALADRFASTSPYRKVTVHGKPIILFHYPISSWHMKFHGAWHLHGHCHGKLQDSVQKRVDVGVDCWDYVPVSFNKLKEYFNDEENRRRESGDDRGPAKRSGESDAEEP